MELSLVLSDDTDQFAVTIGQFIETNVADTLADRTLAQAAASQASVSAAAALASQTDADGAANTAGTSATAAAASATAAGLSASSASSSATTATNQATASMNSASASAGSASAASISAGNAAGSATAASISAGNAAATLTNALMKQNNLTDIANAVTALANLGGAPLATVAPLTNRNRIINGNAIVLQRPYNNAASVTGTTGSYGGPDRFVAINGGAGGTLGQTQGSLIYNGNTYASVKQTASAVLTNLSAGLYWGGIAQAIEGVNCYDLPGNQVAIQFLFRASIAGTYPVSFQIGTTIYSYVTTFAYPTANAVQLVTMVLPVIPIAAAITGTITGSGAVLRIGGQNNGTYATVIGNANTWQAGNYFSFPTGVTNWGLTAGATIEATLIQIEKGSVIHPFEFEDFSVTLRKCQRYCKVWGPGSLLGPGLIVSSTQMNLTLNWGTPLRVAGYTSFYSGINCTSAGYAANASGFSGLSSAGVDSTVAIFTIPTGSSWAGGQPGYATINVGGYFALETEL